MCAHTHARRSAQKSVVESPLLTYRLQCTKLAGNHQGRSCLLTYTVHSPSHVAIPAHILDHLHWMRLNYDLDQSCPALRLSFRPPLLHSQTPPRPKPCREAYSSFLPHYRISPSHQSPRRLPGKHPHRYTPGQRKRLQSDRSRSGIH